MSGTPMQQDSAELFYFGRSTVKIRTGGGFVVYIDPYAPGDYSEAADLVLVTHGHGDHNRVDLVPRRPGCLVASPLGAVAEGGARPVAEGESFTAGPVRVSVLPAANRNHDRASCVGYLLFFDGIVLYHAGDTDYLPEMEGWASLHIGYALLPCDGFYNMGPEGASRCAAAMKARRVIPIHSSKDGSYDAQNARAVRATEVIILIPGGKVALKA